MAKWSVAALWLTCAACVGEGPTGSQSGLTPMPTTSPMPTPTSMPSTSPGTMPTSMPSTSPDPTPTPSPTPSVDPTSPTLALSGAAPSVSGYGAVSFRVDTKTQVTDFVTTLTVPPPPSENQSTLFLWPGLQPMPGSANYNPINNGVLQPVLTWGGSCAPGQQPADYTTWWVSSQYVNTFGHDPNYMGCYGGSIMSVAVGDPLLMHFYLQGTVWTQDVTDLNSGQKVTFAMDMSGQAQNVPEFIIESYGPEPTTDVVFTHTTITFADPSPTSCLPAARGTNDYVSTTRISPDGMHCAVDTVILRAQGLPATNPPPGP